MRHTNKGVTLLETHLQKKNTVNIGYDQQQRIHMCRPLMQKP